MRRTLVCASPWRCGQLLFLAFLSASRAVAGGGQPDSVPVAAETFIEVTWPDIVRLVDQHPRLVAARLEVDAARGGVDAAGAVPNPNLEGSFGRGFERGGDASRTEWEFALSLPLGWIAQRGSRVDAAEAEVDAAEAEREVLRRDVLLQLRDLFWNLAYEQARVASLETLESQTSTLVEAVNKRVENGEVRPVEGIRAEIELEEVGNELESARISLESRQSQLALWFGVPQGMTIRVAADFEVIPAVMDLDAALAKTRATHPALRLARARTRSFAAERNTEKVDRFPSFAITGFATDELDRRAYGVGLAVDFPVWNWNSGRIAQADARLAAGREGALATAREVESAVIEVHAACRSSVATATRFRDSVIPRSEIAASMMEKTYRLGEASLLELIDARRTLLDARRLYLDALARAQIDRSSLGALVGEELP